MQARGPAARGARRERRPGRGKGDNGVGGQMGQRWTNFVTKEALCFNRRRTEDSGCCDKFAVVLSVTAPVARGSTEPHSFEVPAVA